MGIYKRLQIVEGGPYASCTPRERRFVDEYICNGLAAGPAMIAIGYKGKKPHAVGRQWLQRGRVSDACIERRHQLLDDLGVRSERVVRELFAIATLDPRKLVDTTPREDEDGQPVMARLKPLHELDAATAAAISSIEVENISINGRVGTRYKYRFNDKTKALDRLGQFLDLWGSSSGTSINIDNRRVEVNQHVGGTEALRAVNELIGRVAAIGAPSADAPPHQNGSLLPVEVRDVSPGHGASVATTKSKGGSEPA